MHKVTDMKQKGFLVLLILFVSFNLLADGFIVVPRPPAAGPFPLEVVYHRVTAAINDNISETSIDQEFYNPSDRQLEGYYIFPVPENAVIRKFSMEINGRQTEAQMLKADEALSIYERIVRQIKDPALLEYAGRGLLRVRIFPIEPKAVKRIKISYMEEITSYNGVYSYRYPLNTEKFSSRPLQNVSVFVDLKSDSPLYNITAPDYPSDINFKSTKHIQISYEAENVKPDRDYNIYFQKSQAGTQISLLTYREKDESGYFYLTIDPGRNSSPKIVNRDIAFLLDVSGSMRGEKIEQAKNALRWCVENLNSGDRFQIVTFSTEAQTLFSGMRPAGGANRRKAYEFIENITALGGTHIEDAFRKTFQNGNKPDMVILLTDGKPTIGITDGPGLLQKISGLNGPKTKIFTFGIGYDINTVLLDRIADSTNAIRSYISPEEDIHTKIESFYKTVRSPVLTDVTVDFGNTIRITKMHPQKIPDIYADRPVTVYGKYSGSGKTQLTVSGRTYAGKKKITYNANFFNVSKKYDFIPHLWASRRIGFLLDRIRFYGENDELVDEAAVLARRFGIVTPYTSYLIVEEEMRRYNARQLTEDDLVMDRYAVSQQDELKEEYEQIKRSTGEAGVNSSKSIQNLKNTDALIPAKEYAVKEKHSVISKIINGRVFYKKGNIWIDSDIQQNSAEIIRIRFDSEEYYKFIRTNRELSAVIALGRNIRFMHGGNLYIIYE